MTVEWMLHKQGCKEIEKNMFPSSKRQKQLKCKKKCNKGEERRTAWTYPSPGTHWTDWRHWYRPGDSCATSPAFCRYHTVRHSRFHHDRSSGNTDHTSAAVFSQCFCSDSSSPSWKTNKQTKKAVIRWGIHVHVCCFGCGRSHCKEASYSRHSEFKDVV